MDSMLKIVGVAAVVAVALGALAAEKLDATAADKAALAALQGFVGQWKGAGQLRRGSTQGAWTEQAEWAWQFKAGHARLAFTSVDGKYFRSGTLAAGDKPGEFTLTATLTDGKTEEQFVGKLDGERLTLLTAKPADGHPARITLRQVAGGDRLVVLYEQSIGEQFARLAEVGFTREGSEFAKGSNGPECIVTGGKGTIPVQYKGETYYVCCSGCRDLFKDNPEAVLAEYRQRLAKEKAEAAKSK